VRLPEGLLHETQRRLESLYALPAQRPVGDFLMTETQAGDFAGRGSRTLVREAADGALDVAVVLEDDVCERLARADPRIQLDDRNLAPYCTLIEEVSHFVYVLFCAHVSRSVTQLELELQGEVDKYLTSAFVISLQNEGAVSPLLRELLFHHWHLSPGMGAEQAERYRAANDLAYRYTGWLESSFLRASRLGELTREARRFYRLGQCEKLERIAAI
jgi:hypothetical protein